MVTVSWFGYGIVIVDAGEPHIRYLKSDFLRDTGLPAEAEELVRVLFDDFNEYRYYVVHLELLSQTDRWVANANVQIDARTVVPRSGDGETVLEALKSLMNDIRANR